VPAHLFIGSYFEKNEYFAPFGVGKVFMKKAPKVDRAEFEKILGRMINTPPEKRPTAKTPKKASKQ
jgi:hypothetical protein